METALIGLAGVLLGILINEILRRQNRIESYAGRVFEKRLEIYEGLYHRVAALGPLASDLINNSTYSYEERHQIVSVGVHDVASWCDDNDMYINEELAVHCVPLFNGHRRRFRNEGRDCKAEGNYTISGRPARR